MKTYLADLHLSYKMLRDPHFQIDKQTKMVLIIALFYIITPIDLVDDVLVAGYALRQAAVELERYRQTVATR